MNQENQNKIKLLWEMRHLTVDECLKKIANTPGLKFLLTSVGLWFLVKCLLRLWVGAHVIYIVYRIFNLVSGNY